VPGDCHEDKSKFLRVVFSGSEVGVTSFAVFISPTNLKNLCSFAVLEEDFSNAFVMLTKGFELCNHKDSILLNNLLVMFDNADD
jgi:hypothetical protein